MSATSDHDSCQKGTRWRWRKHWAGSQRAHFPLPVSGESLCKLRERGLELWTMAAKACSACCTAARTLGSALSESVLLDLPWSQESLVLCTQRRGWASFPWGLWRESEGSGRFLVRLYHQGRFGPQNMNPFGASSSLTLGCLVTSQQPTCSLNRKWKIRAIHYVSLHH